MPKLLIILALIFSTLLLLNIAGELKAVPPSSFAITSLTTGCNGTNPYNDIFWNSVDNVTPNPLVPNGDRYEVYLSPSTWLANDYGNLTYRHTTPTRGQNLGYYVIARDATAPYYGGSPNSYTTPTVNVTTAWCDPNPPSLSLNPPLTCYATISPAAALFPDPAFSVTVTDSLSGVNSVTYTLTNISTNATTTRSSIASPWSYSKAQAEADLVTLGGPGPNKRYSIKVNACDRAGNCTPDTTPLQFDYKTTCLNPFFKSVGGDIHSNIKIQQP